MGFVKDVVIGDYDWHFLCMPRVPCSARKPPPPLFRKDEPISLLVAIAMGFQHCLAMVGGIITVPLVISGRFYGNFNQSEQQYIISAALIVSGIASFVQVTQIPIPFTKYAIGSGLLAVMGISFTFLPIAQNSIQTMRSCACVTNGISKPCTVGGTCGACTGSLSGECLTGTKAYGRVLGTVACCGLLQVFISFVPNTILRRLFPPVVSGVTVLLIGFALVATGFKYWGGGVFCAEQVLTSKALCTGNGEVILPYGSRQYVGLGFAVFSTLVVTELFGSPFLRNIQVAVGLLVGMIVASSTSMKQCKTNCVPPVCPCFQVLPGGLSYDNSTNTITGASNNTFYTNGTICLASCGDPVCGEPICTRNRFVTSTDIDNAPWITFIWKENFGLGFYAPAILPMLFGFLVTSMECIGDITATTEASGLVPVGEEFERAIQGGVLADGLASIWGALATMLPPVTYAQNNGIISLTRCASRRAGWCCAIFLFVLGVFAKFAGVILSIPDCVLGGMTSFLFINVCISGMKILTMGEGISRRNRFIASLALALGVGIDLVPEFFNITGQAAYPNQGNFWKVDSSWSKAYRGFRDALIIVLSTGFSIGGFTALICNLIVPGEIEEEEVLMHSSDYAESMKAGNALGKPEEQKMGREV